MRFVPRFGLSATQLLATALAAITATIAASFLGVTGTVIGAALASVTSAIGTAVYSHSLNRTHARVRAGMQKSRLHAVAIGSLALFVTVLTLVTGVELVSGRPLSDIVRGDTGSGTTVFGTTKNAAEWPAPVPTVTQTVTPSVVVVTPTVTQTAPAVTRTATPTATAAPTPTATSTGATPVPTATPTASDQPTS